MILKQNTYFEGFIIKEMIEKSSSYREVYRVKDINNDNDCVITIYDLKSLPKCYTEAYIPEFDLIKKTSVEYLPHYINGGRYVIDDVDLLWMATDCVSFITLSDYLNTQNDLDVDVLLHQFRKFLIDVDKLSSLLGDGCHNNINCDNIIVSKGNDDLPIFHLSGLECISCSCDGGPSFDTGIQSIFYRAPETLLGKYNISTDIYSLGIVLSLCLQTKHPWQNVIEENKDIKLKGFIKSIRQQEPVLDMDDAIKSIVYKAIALKPSLRYKSIEQFCMAIEDYLGIEPLERYYIEKLYSEKDEKNIEENDSDEEDDEEDVDDPFKSQAPSQPKTELRIERVTGNGFKDVAGMVQLKNMLTRNFVDIVRNPELAKQYKITPPNGMLLWGPPGNGKTFITRKLAEECGMLYCMVNPSDLGNIYIHGSQKLIADLFKRSEKLAKRKKCGVLLVFDEFDSLVPRRDDNKADNKCDEVAEFLAQLNNCSQRNIFVVAMTNRIDAIDTAVLRRGRIDLTVYVDLPDKMAREELFNIELKELPHDNLDMERLVKMTEGFCASDISFVVKECARCSFQESLKMKQVVNISQELLENIITTTKSSVGIDEIRRYEKLRDNFERCRSNERPRIGFNA